MDRLCAVHRGRSLNVRRHLFFVDGRGRLGIEGRSRFSFQIWRTAAGENGAQSGADDGGTAHTVSFVGGGSAYREKTGDAVGGRIRRKRVNYFARGAGSVAFASRHRAGEGGSDSGSADCAGSLFTHHDGVAEFRCGAKNGTGDYARFWFGCRRENQRESLYFG